jgi:hypothetical protein
MITDDPQERRAALDEGEALLAAGAISHNHVFFRLHAIELSLRLGEFDEAERHAGALAGFCPEDGLDLVVFHADRGRALARAGRGENSPGLAAEIDRLIGEGERMQQNLALADLRRAKDAMAA